MLFAVTLMDKILLSYLSLAITGTRATPIYSIDGKFNKLKSSRINVHIMQLGVGSQRKIYIHTYIALHSITHKNILTSNGFKNHLSLHA